MSQGLVFSYSFESGGSVTLAITGNVSIKDAIWITRELLSRKEAELAAKDLAAREPPHQHAGPPSWYGRGS